MIDEGFLAIDIGNSRLKATWFAPGGETDIKVFTPEDTDGILRLAETLGARHAAMACVGHVDSRLVESMRFALSDKFLLITPQTQLPIELSYPNPETLGLDRKATSVAVAQDYPNDKCLVIDAGSALTCDLVADRKFLGGSISPGLFMRFRALNEFTAALPLVEPDDFENYSTGFASDTAGAIKNGIINGFMHEIAGDILLASAQFLPLDRVVITGGDGPFVRELLETGNVGRSMREMLSQIKITYESHLLAKGMRAIYTHHENEF